MKFINIKMDFILGSNNTEKTTCLLHMANEYIIENKINANNGYVLLFSPPFSENESFDSINQNKSYNFNQYFTNYKEKYKENMNLIKCYTINNLSKAYGIINNFILISYENKGLKLILIDNIEIIINSLAEEKKKKQIIKVKPEDRPKIDNNIKYYNYLFNEIFQEFLSKILFLQQRYQCKCFITIDMNISKRFNFSKNSPEILFNAIFPYIRTIFYLNKENDKIIYNELHLFLNQKSNKIIYEILEDDENENKIDDHSFLKEKIEKLEKKAKQMKNFITNEKYKNWIKNVLDDFVKNMNHFNELKKQLEEKKRLNQENQEEEDSSFTQIDKEISTPM